MGVGHFPTLHYMQVSQLDLFNRYIDTVESLYSFETIYKKAVPLFSGGNFIRKGGQISPWLKARLSWIAIREFVFTEDKDRRKLFRFIIQLIRGKQIAIDKGLGFMLSMLGYHNHIKEHRKNIESYRLLIKKQDLGAWKHNLDH
jgi:hypothetical protein